MDHPLGALISDEVTRAEADLAAWRTRAQSVLTISGLLVTATAGLLAVAVGRDTHLNLSTTTSAAAAGTLTFFVLATVMVLVIFLPVDVQLPDEQDLAEYAEKNWNAEGWDQQVARNLAQSLRTLRKVNRSVAKKLALAITFQVCGVFGVTIMALSLLISAKA